MKAQQLTPPTSKRSRPPGTKAGKSSLKKSLEPTSQKSRPIAKGKRIVWIPTLEAQKVIDACQDVFDNTPGASGDCSKFVKSVCDKFKVNPFSDTDNADAITKDIRDRKWCAQNGWTQLNEDPQKAKNSADRGELIVAGATSQDLNQLHGHVVVVVDSERLWKGYPYASWGRLGGVGTTNERMTKAYKLADLPKVSYMTKKV